MSLQASGQVRHGLEYDDEYLFLRERELALAAELDERDALLDDEYPEGIERPRGQAEWGRLWRRELEVVRDLQERVARVPLEIIVGRRLRQVHLCLARLGALAHDRGHYSPEYWREEEERTILNSLLRQWWEWRYGPRREDAS